MSNTQERLATLQFEITTLRAQLADMADVVSHSDQRMYLFRELVYCLATYDALRRKQRRHPNDGLRQRAVNQLDQPICG
jgi:hypothetical protein